VQEVELKIDETWSFAELGEVISNVWAVVDEQRRMLRELADDEDGDHIGCKMLFQRSEELGTQLELLRTMMRASAGGSSSIHTHTAGTPSTLLQVLRDRIPQERQAEAKELGVDAATFSTPRGERLRLRASGIYSVKRTLEAQVKRLQRVESSLPAMAPALKPVRKGLEGEVQELVRLLDHTIRQLELGGRWTGGSITQQQEWLRQAENATLVASISEGSSDDEAAPTTDPPVIRRPSPTMRRQSPNMRRQSPNMRSASPPKRRTFSFSRNPSSSRASAPQSVLPVTSPTKTQEAHLLL